LKLHCFTQKIWITTSFVNKEIQNRDTEQLRKLCSLLLLHGDQVDELRAELEFIAVHCDSVIKSLKALEAQEFKASEIFNEMSDVLLWLHNAGFPYATSSCEEAMTNAAKKWRSMYKE